MSPHTPGGELVQITPVEFAVASLVGSMREISAHRDGRQHVAGGPIEDGIRNHVLGAVGELAVAKALNVFWGGSVNTFKLAGDVGRIEVRHTARHENRLLVREQDPDARAFVLVTGYPPELVVRGWIWGADAKVDRWAENPGDRGRCYFVPQGELYPIRDLVMAGAA